MTDKIPPLPSRWDQCSIWDWSRDTFGPTSTMEKAVRANKEMSELLTAVSNKLDDVKIAEEAADITIFMMQICEQLGYNLDSLVQDKMNINERRKWEKKDDGSFQHV